MKNFVFILIVLVTLSGCSLFRSKGCEGQACDRPQSDDSSVVIWWPASMRQGLNDGQEPLDYSVGPRE